MATILLALSFAVPVFAQESSDNSVLIDSLLEERAALICLEKWNEVDSLDQQLESLGVEKLTAAEVDERFGSINGATPYVSKPASTNVTWLSSRTNYTYIASGISGTDNKMYRQWFDRFHRMRWILYYWNVVLSALERKSFTSSG